MYRGVYLSRAGAIGAIEELRKDPRARGKEDKIEEILLKYGADEDDTDPDEGLYASMYTQDIKIAYEDILNLLTKELVDVYVKVASGWELLFEQIPEDVAHTIWQAGFATGENKISIETKTSKWVREYNKRQLGIKSSTTVRALKKKSRINASKYYEGADTYVVKIWHEIDPGHDVVAPVAAEEIFEVVAGSPSEAKERAAQMWNGPINRIEIVDINPDDDYDEIPFNAATDIDDDIITFNEWVERQYGEGFDPSGLSDEEFYELEDYYREDVPVNRREYAYR